MKKIESSPDSRLASVKPNFITRWGFLIFLAVLIPAFTLFSSIHYKHIRQWDFHIGSGIGSDSILSTTINVAREDSAAVARGSDVNVVFENVHNHKINVVRGRVIDAGQGECEGAVIIKILLLDRFSSRDIEDAEKGQIIVSNEVRFFQRFVLPI